MLRVFVLCAILTLVEPHFRRHYHNYPPFNERPGAVLVTNGQKSGEESLPYKRHCHSHLPFHGNPCLGVVDTDQSSSEETGRKFPPHRSRCPYWFCSGTTERPTSATSLQTIERDLAEQEGKFLEFCRNNSPNNVKEMYGTDSYFLKYDLPDAKTSKVTVQIKNKFIHTTVTKKNGDHGKVFEDVKLLPDIANADAATWTTHNNKVLKITIPYKVPLGTEIVKDCETGNSNVIDVPAFVYPDFIYYRNADKITKN